MRAALAAAACAALLLAAPPLVSPAAAQGRNNEKVKNRIRSTKFFRLVPFTLPLFKDGMVSEQFTLVIVLELTDEEKRGVVENLVPKIRDRMYRVLYRMVSFRRKGAPLPDVDAFKKRLLDVALEVAGSEVVTALLVQQAFKRKVR